MYEQSGVVSGDTEAVEDAAGDHYVKIHRQEAQEEGEEGGDAQEGGDTQEGKDE